MLEVRYWDPKSPKVDGEAELGVSGLRWEPEWGWMGRRDKDLSSPVPRGARTELGFCAVRRWGGDRICVPNPLPLPEVRRD